MEGTIVDLQQSIRTIIKEITIKEWKKNESNNKELRCRSRRKQRLKPRSKN